jgi:hypothetical protein
MGSDVVEMTRLPDWRSRLRAYVEQKARQNFRPGTHDCAMFVAGGVEAMTGTDPAAEWRGTYRSLKKARARLDEAGTDMASIAAAQLPEVEPIFAQEGDVAVLDGADGHPAFGLVQGAFVYVLTPDGLGLVPLTDARRAFRV